MSTDEILEKLDIFLIQSQAAEAELPDSLKLLYRDLLETRRRATDAAMLVSVRLLLLVSDEEKVDDRAEALQLPLSTVDPETDEELLEGSGWLAASILLQPLSEWLIGLEVDGDPPAETRASALYRFPTLEPLQKIAGERSLNPSQMLKNYLEAQSIESHGIRLRSVTTQRIF